MAKCVAIANQKGGVGKTTLCVNLAWSLACLGFPTLLVDLDPQGNASSSLNMKKMQGGGVHKLLTSGRWDEDLLVSITPNKLYGLPSSPSLRDLDHSRKTGNPLKLQELMMPQQDRWSYILIDCPPSLGTLTLNALSSADAVLIPVQAEYLAMEGLVQMLEAMKRVRTSIESPLQLAGIVINMLNPEDEGMREAATEMRSHFGSHVFSQALRRDPVFAEAPSHGVGIMRHRPRSPGALAWTEFAREFLFRSAA